MNGTLKINNDPEMNINELFVFSESAQEWTKKNATGTGTGTGTGSEITIDENQSFFKYKTEEFAIARFSVILFDKVEKVWTLAYNQGPIGLDVREVSIFAWVQDQGTEKWQQCTIKNSTHLLLHPQQSSIGIVSDFDLELKKSVLFLIKFPNHELIVEWNRPDLKDTRFLYNEIFMPLAATTGISVMSSLLFPKFIVDPKRAVGWAIPGWLMLDGLNVFNKVINGAYTPRTVPVLKDKTFWIKAVASSIGPLIGSAMVKKI